MDLDLAQRHQQVTSVVLLDLYGGGAGGPGCSRRRSPKPRCCRVRVSQSIDIHWVVIFAEVTAASRRPHLGSRPASRGPPRHAGIAARDSWSRHR